MLLLDACAADTLAKTGKVVWRTPIGVGITRAEEGGFYIEAFRVPSGDLLCKHPHGIVGAQLPVSVREPFGNTRQLGAVLITQLDLQFVEEITDEQIIAEGCVNWSEYAYRWNQLNPKSPWDLNPLCWVAELSSR